MTKIGVAVFPGSNCDRDVHRVLNSVLGIDVEFVWHTKDKLSGYDAMIIPGGFAYGDRLRAGIIAAHSPIINEVKRMAKEGLPVLGICNGFQILVESGLLPGALMMNDSLKFICRWTSVEVLNENTPFTNLFKRNQTIRIPIAHGEGRYMVDEDELGELKKNNQIVLRYYDDNPNGSTNYIAAICNKERNVLGMMPHPERASENILAIDEPTNNGLLIFQSILAFIEGTKVKGDSVQ
jgi:phosphoribosylformylglycinamidine synthase